MLHRLAQIAACLFLAQTVRAETPLERGRYLVDRVALCGDCHTPRDWKGHPRADRYLQGAKLDFAPTSLMPWAKIAPPIAGLPSFPTDAQAVNYFKTGENAAGKKSSPPMAQYRLEAADAEAVVAYLRSLKPATNQQPKLDTSTSSK